MELKEYQKGALDTFSHYLRALKDTGSSKRAFIEVTDKPYQAESFDDIPFVCVKIPTGGGKTLVGCHVVQKILQTALQEKMERGIVMWFVPSEAIKTQTLKKFKDRNDPHRRILDEAFENGVRVFSNEEALRIKKEDVNANLCIIISSIDAFRKEKTLQNKYKVYKDNGALLGHFESGNNNEGLEKDEEGAVIYSLANVIRKNNPLIVVDEGHKTTTKLSIDFINELNPSFIVEYTATPRNNSNVLVDISAAALKKEEMVKIPIVLESATQWSVALARGCQKRIELERETKKLKGEYIRPIALIQAQPKSGTVQNVTVEEIRDFLLKAKIAEDEIAIKTSEQNDLESVDLFSKKCKIRYIITVSALAEGWDCSFAYILVSVANIGAKIAVEQIIGRIIRMPNAKKKADEELNRSYIFASAKNFNEAAGEIISGLESHGYSKADLINVSDKDQKNEIEIERAINEDFAPPVVSFDGEALTYEDLIGKDFRLAKQKVEFDFDIHFDNDGRAIIDINEENKWTKGRQQMLHLIYKDRDFTEAELVQWLDKKLRYAYIAKQDKVDFLAKALQYQLKSRSLVELSINRYVLLDKLAEVIGKILDSYAKERFDELHAKKEIKSKVFQKYAETLSVSDEIPQEFNKNYYKKIEKLNKEELQFVERLDLDELENIKFWVRNREKADPFYIQGWKRGRFYPDFLAVTKKGNIIALEWKGEDRVSNEDTAYKTEIGKMWAGLSMKLHFYLVHNKNVEEVLNEIKKL